MKTINIGTYDKEEGFKIRDEVKKYAKHRNQKITVRFKGRGKGSGKNDGSYKHTPKVAIYLDLESEINKNLTIVQRHKIIEKLKYKVNIREDQILHGFKGLYYMNDDELLNLMMDEI